MLYTAKQAAEQLGVSYKRLCWLAQHYKVGSKMPRILANVPQTLGGHLNSC
jgi:hypothetical protein